MSIIKLFKDLIVWQKSRDLAVAIYELTEQFSQQINFIPLSSTFYFLFSKFCFIILLPAFYLLLSGSPVIAGSGSNFKIEILSFCGNGVIDQGEQCDGLNLAGQTCSSRGFSGGSLSCNSNCTINTSQCASAPSGGGGGGGGGGGYTPPAIITQVIFTGRAYPLSKVGVLKDGQSAITTVAGPDANFNVSLTGLSSGNYIFAVFGEDNQGRRSSLFTFPVFITQGATTQVSGIFIAPTIAVDKSEVKRGDNIAIFGQSAPNSEVTISVNSAEEFFNKIKADAGGAYLLNFDTSPLEIAQHFTKSKAALNGEITSFSKAIGFVVGTKTVFAQPTAKFLKGDLNNDGRVNLVDFSIAAYWYKRPLSAAFKPIEVERLNGDGKIDLVDFSIMAFYWTG